MKRTDAGGAARRRAAEALACVLGSTRPMRKTKSAKKSPWRNPRESGRALDLRRLPASADPAQAATRQFGRR